MILFKRSEDLRHWLEREKSTGKTTGFVPTMGALHEGHMRLIEACRSQTDLCICSIFVNPVQFNDPADYQKYPVSLEKDIKMLENAGTSVVFLPSIREIYPQGEEGLEKYDLGRLESVLEGSARPGHFQGVCQVMNRLLGHVKPDHLFMGQKDFQQCLVIKHLIEMMHMPVQLQVVPTVREVDGLAQSSRNRLLTSEQRKNAIAISQALTGIHKQLSTGNIELVLHEAQQKLDAAHFSTDYITIARTSDLQPIQKWNGSEKGIALIAAFQGDVRLIDNILLN